MLNMFEIKSDITYESKSDLKRNANAVNNFTSY